MHAETISPFMSDALVILGAAGIVIPLFARFRITPIIGFILVGLLVGQGATAGTAVALTVLVRLLTLWLAVALGLLALLYSAGIRKDISFQ